MFIIGKGFYKVNKAKRLKNLMNFFENSITVILKVNYKVQIMFQGQLA